MSKKDDEYEKTMQRELAENRRMMYEEEQQRDQEMREAEERLRREIEGNS